jgi:hypothetical protein
MNNGFYEFSRGRQETTTTSSVFPYTGSAIITGSLGITGSLSQGENVIASGSFSHAEGNLTKAIGDYSHAEGDNTQAKGNYSHAEGQETISSGSYSHAEGYLTIAIGERSHAEGESTQAIGYASHAEGYLTQAIGAYSHAEGQNTKAIGNYSHAEGFETIASGSNSHAEGVSTQAIGASSHAEGLSTQAIGDFSHAEGLATVAAGNYQHVQGQYNISSSAQSAFIIGNGSDSNDRRNLIFAAGNTVQITGSLNVSGSITGSLFGTSSFAISSSRAVSSSFATTSSFVNPLNQNVIISGSLKLDPTQDPDPTGLDLDSTVLFQSSSNTALGYDLYVRQNGNLVKWKWIEGILETGLLYGGVVTYSGSNVFISPGSGIIAEHNATTSSEISPMIEYVTWNAITQSVTNIATQQVTYLYIDQNGSLQQQSTRFTSQQYHNSIPLGAVGHFDYTQVSAFGGAVQTAYDQGSQTSNFIDAFGPLKVSGYGLTGQTNSLRLSVGSGISFIHGGFYQNDPEFPSQITTPSQATASLARVQRSGSSIEFDTNAGNLYTVVDPTQYDRDGDGVLHSVGSGNWSIQRVFSDPKTGVLYVYYGQARYTSLLNALQFLPTDPFTEGDTFDFTTFIGFLVLKGNASDITDTADNSVINAGLFRGSGQGSGGGIALSNLEDLTDVSITSPINGEALIYDSGIWRNGIPISASFSSTASFAQGGNGSFSGSFSGSGANLFNIPASGITGLNLSQIATGSVTASVSTGTGSFQIISGSTSLMFISSSGNIGIGNNLPLGKLSVTDTLLASGSANAGSLLDLRQTWNTTGAPSAIRLDVTDTASNANSILMDLRVANSPIVQVYKSGVLAWGGLFGASGALLSTSGGTLRLAHKFSSEIGYAFDFRANSGARTAGSGDSGHINIFQAFSPTSGTGIYNAVNIGSNYTINQTGGASGVTRGLFINPTLTAAADFRAIENAVGNNLLNSTSGNTYVGLSTNTGTARLQVRGTGATSSTNTLILQNSSLTNLLTVRDDGSSTLIGRLNITPTTSTTSSLVVTGPTVLSGSLTVTGSTTITGSLSVTEGITGSLLGTASFASTASFAPSYLPIATPITSGLEITFTQDRLYGTLSSPETGSTITANTSSAIPLVTNLIIHSASAAPTTGSDFKKIVGSQDYVAGINYIYCTYMQDNQINYLITQTE